MRSRRIPLLLLAGALGLMGTLTLLEVLPAVAQADAPPPAPTLAPTLLSPAIRMAPQRNLTLTLSVGLHSRMASGATPFPDPVALTLRRGDEVLVHTTVTPFPDGTGGYLYVATLTWYGSYRGGYSAGTLQPGDVLEVVQVGETLSLTIPTLTALADAATATVFGQATPGTSLEVRLYASDSPGTFFTQTVTSTATGDYRADWSSVTALAPRDYGYVVQRLDARRQVYLRYNVPYLEVGLQAHYGTVLLAPATSFTATLFAPTGETRSTFRQHTDSQGEATFYFQKSPQVSDTVVVTAAGQVVSLTLFPLEVRPDPNADRLVGQTLPNLRLQADLYPGPLWEDEGALYGRPGGTPEVSRTVTATAGGQYTVSLAGLVDLVPGYYGVLYATTPQGYRLYRLFAAPFLRLHLPGYTLQGQLNGGSRVTVTIAGPSGIPKDVRSFALASSSPTFLDFSPSLALSPGDRITLTTDVGRLLTLTVPLLTARLDRSHSQVIGQAPPGSRVRVEIGHYACEGKASYEGGCPFTLLQSLWTTATVSGRYTVTYDSSLLVQPDLLGLVYVTLPGGHEVYRSFPVAGAKVQVGGRWVETGPFITRLLLRDASGQVKATARLGGGCSYSYPLCWYLSQPIAPGDQIEMETSQETITISVPPLSLEADPAHAQLKGVAPPGATLRITWHGRVISPHGWKGPYPYPEYPVADWVNRVYQTVTATQAGTFTLELEGATLRHGDWGEVHYTDAEGYEFWAADYLPGLDLTLGDTQITVIAPPDRPMTLTLFSDSGERLYRTTVQRKEGGWWGGQATVRLGSTLLRPGQRVQLTGITPTSVLTIPRLSAYLDRDRKLLRGEAPIGARLRVGIQDNEWTVTATTGTYQVDLTEVALTAETGGQVLYESDSGDAVRLDFFAPQLWTKLGKSCVGGRMPAVGEPVTVTLRGAQGGIKAQAIITPSQWTLSFFQCWPEITVGGGDQVEMAGTDYRYTMTVPSLTARFDQRTGLLRGTAPPGAWLEALLWRRDNGGLYGATRHVRADDEGIYALDWSDLTFRSGDEGWIAYTDERGNRTMLGFTIPYYRVYLPLVTR